MTNTPKLTNRKALEYAISVIGDSNPEVVEKLNKMILALDKKNASPKKLTAKQEANEVLKDKIVEFLGDNADRAFTATELLKAIPEFNGDSNQHISALLRALVLDNAVRKFTEKRKTYFAISNGEIEIEVEGE